MRDLTRAPAGLASTLGRFTTEIGRRGMLTAEDERELAAAIRRGRRASATSVRPGDGETGVRVSEAIQAGIDARHRLVTGNLAWVIRVARTYATPSVPFEDLLQAGSIGLLVAAESFDPDRGRFTTYATFYVKDEIRRSIEDGGPGLRLRLEVRREAAIVRAAAEQLGDELGRSPTSAELAVATGLTEAAVRRVDGVGLAPRSLDDPLPGELVLEDPRAKVEQLVLARSRATAARRLLGILTPRQAEVVRLRFGLDDGTARNRAEIGRMLEISRERVRQLERDALERLRGAAEHSGTPV